MWCSLMPSTGQLVDQGEDALQCLDEGRRIEQLRTDVAVDAGYRDVGQGGRAAIEVERVVVGDAELGLLEAGRDVRMGLRIDVRIDAQADRRPLAALAGHFIQALQFRDRLDIEAEDAGFQRQLHFRSRLADAREDDFLRVGTGGQHALQFAAGDDVETGTEAGEQVEDGEVGVGLDGVADQRAVAGRMGVQYVLEFTQRLGQRSAGIDIGRRAELFGNGGQGDGFGVQDAVLQGKGTHGFGVWVSVLTSGPVLAGWALVDGAGFGLPNSGSGAGPVGRSSGPFMPQAARPRMISKAAILDMVWGAVSEERDGSTRWMTRISTSWPTRCWPGSRQRSRRAMPISTLNWGRRRAGNRVCRWQQDHRQPPGGRQGNLGCGARLVAFISAGMVPPGATPATTPNCWPDYRPSPASRPASRSI